ncbi:MAG: hypothetical protein JST68_29440 [Bacteroidetes bacterium]|nr:hypothetical protein [Bacteroidota bacterium]
MKHIFIILSILISTLAASAQSDSLRTAEGRATALTEKMKTRLSLTDDQSPQVQSINLKYAEKNEEIFKGSQGKFAKFRALQSSQKSKNKEMKAILDKDQYKKYEEMVEEMKEKTREQYKNRSNS